MNLIKSHKYKLSNRFIFQPDNDLLKNIDSNEIIHLGSNESRLLLFLVEHNSEIVSREQLHQYVWRDQGFEVDDSSLTQAISTLRKVLNDSTKTPQFIRTMPKRGYRFIASVDSILSEINDDIPQNNINENPLSPSQTSTNTLSNHEENIVNDSSDNIEAEYDHAQINNEVEQVVLFENVLKTEKNHEKSVNQGAHKRKRKKCIFSKPVFYFLWVIIFLLPIGILLLDDPIKTEFKTLGTVNDVPVIQKAIQEDLTPWFGVIKTCTSRYIRSLEENDRLYKVIVSHTHSDKFILNFIHENKTINNHTMIFFIDSDDVVNLCS